MGFHLSLPATGQRLGARYASSLQREKGAQVEGFMNLRVRRILAAGAGVALTAVLSAAAGAQNQPASDGSNTQPQSQPQHQLQMVPVRATLDHTLDAKKAKQGDPVTAKLEKDVQIPDAQLLPRNTVLEGHIDQVEASDHKSDSMMVVTFDKAKLKDGQELPIKATVMAVSLPASMQQADAGQPMSPGAGPMSSGSMASGGGAKGGTSSGSSSTAQPMNMPQPGSGSAQQAQPNGVPDVTLKSSIHDHSSATFTSKGRNVHVPDGTQMEVALTIVPAGVTLQ